MPPARRLRQDELFYDPVKVEDEDSNQRINNAQDHRSATGIWKETAGRKGLVLRRFENAVLWKNLWGYPRLIVFIWHAYISEE